MSKKQYRLLVVLTDDEATCVQVAIDQYIQRLREQSGGTEIDSAPAGSCVENCKRAARALADLQHGRSNRAAALVYPGQQTFDRLFDRYDGELPPVPSSR